MKKLLLLLVLLVPMLGTSQWAYEDVLLLIDDLKARKLAKKLNLRITGALGVIHKAKQLSLIDKVKPLIDKILLTDFRIADNIVAEIMRINNE